MFVVAFEYTASSAEIEALRPSHRAWLETLLARELLLAGGPLVGADGGLAIFLHESRAALDAELAQDPYLRDGAAHHHVTEFTARMRLAVIGHLS